jgi:hypothetical protein
LAFFYFLAWIVVGNDEFEEIIMPVFNPPQNIENSGELDPGTVRYALQRKLDSTCFEANLTDLAVKGYILIEEESSASSDDKISFISRTEKEISNELPIAEVSLLERLFHTESKVLVNEDMLLSSQAFIGSESDMREFGDKVFTLNREYWILGVAFLLLFPVLGHMSNMAMRFVLSLAVLSYIYYSKLDRIFKKWSYSLSFRIRRMIRPTILSRPIHFIKRISPHSILQIFFLPYMAVVLSLAVFFFHAFFLNCVFIVYLSISGVLCCLFVFLLHKLLPKYTKSGKKLITAALGLKLYMTTIDRSKIEYMDPPEDTPFVFERLLPWATAFGIIEIWRFKFKNILKGDNHNLEWYSGDKNREKLLYGTSSTPTTTDAKEISTSCDSEGGNNDITTADN